MGAAYDIFFGGGGVPLEAASTNNHRLQNWHLKGPSY